jgi:hypothetical protein
MTHTFQGTARPTLDVDQQKESDSNSLTDDGLSYEPNSSADGSPNGRNAGFKVSK